MVIKAYKMCCRLPARQSGHSRSDNLQNVREPSVESPPAICVRLHPTLLPNLIRFLRIPRDLLLVQHLQQDRVTWILLGPHFLLLQRLRVHRPRARGLVFGEDGFGFFEGAFKWGEGTRPGNAPSSSA